MEFSLLIFAELDSADEGIALISLLTKSLMVMGVFLIMVVMVVIMLVSLPMRRHGQQRERDTACAEASGEPILIEDSPPPTRMMSIPPEMITNRRRRTHFMSPRRAGKTRLQQHKKPTTLCYDPRHANHCGHVCLPKLALGYVKPSHIQHLREITAQGVYHAFTNDLTCGGLRMKSVIGESGLTPRHYVAQVRDQQWAS